MGEEEKQTQAGVRKEHFQKEEEAILVLPLLSRKAS